jgi:hypothetical protein
MPTSFAMSQISRPFQIALAAFAAFGVLWFVALRPHPSTGASAVAPGASAPVPVHTVAPATPATPPAASHAAKKPGPLLPGVAGLDRAIAKARATASAAKAQANHFSHESATATGGTPSTATPSGAPSVAPTHTSKPAKAAPTPAATASATPPGAAHAKTPAAPGAHVASPAATASAGHGASTSSAGRTHTPAKTNPYADALAVQHELAQGKIPVILFWNPSSANDREVRQQLKDVGNQHGRLAVHLASASQAAAYGSLTSAVSVLETPTLMIVNHKGQVSTLTGITDATDIRQAIGDAEQGGAGTAQVPTLAAWTPGSSRSHFIGAANNVCHEKARASSVKFGSLSDDAQSFSVITSVAQVQLAQLKRLPTPASDRAYLHHLMGLLSVGLGDFHRGISGISANANVARNELLQAQVYVDQGSQGLADYGLTGCFPQASSG